MPGIYQVNALGKYRRPGQMWSPMRVQVAVEQGSLGLFQPVLVAVRALNRAVKVCNAVASNGNRWQEDVARFQVGLQSATAANLNSELGAEQGKQMNDLYGTRSAICAAINDAFAAPVASKNVRKRKSLNIG